MWSKLLLELWRDVAAARLDAAAPELGLVPAGLGAVVSRKRRVAEGARPLPAIANDPRFRDLVGRASETGGVTYGAPTRDKIAGAREPLTVGADGHCGAGAGAAEPPAIWPGWPAAWEAAAARMGARFSPTAHASRRRASTPPTTPWRARAGSAGSRYSAVIER